MKTERQKRYKIILRSGKRIFLTRGDMSYALLEKQIQDCIKDNSFLEISCALLYGWKAYAAYTEKEFMRDINDNFTKPEEIKQILMVGNERRRREHDEFQSSILRRKKENVVMRIYNKIKSTMAGSNAPADIDF